MDRVSGAVADFDRLLEETIRDPVYLTADEAGGGWRVLFPDLAESLAPPYPIFCGDEERVVLRGYPILMSNGIRKLQAEVDGLIAVEVEYRIAPVEERSAEKRTLMTRRERYARTVAAIFENTLVNDYGRGLFDVFLLFHTADIARAIGHIPMVLRRKERAGQMPEDRLVMSIGDVFADLIRHAASAAADNLRRLSHTREGARFSPLLGVVCEDQLLLLESRVPTDFTQISGYLRARHAVDARELTVYLQQSARKLRELVDEQPMIGDLLTLASGIDLGRRSYRALVEPRLLDGIEASGLGQSIDMPVSRISTLRELGIRLKRFELLAAVRQLMLPMKKKGGAVVLAGADEATPIAPSTRPFDFTTPGVVSSAVERFGLIYDLTNFTQILEEVRKKGHKEEERALQFMYVFQGQLERIRERRRLKFEKFLGDGAFYSSRRGMRVLAAACEVQTLYDGLRKSGFPFDLGMRIAMNYGGYQLLPMWTHEPGMSRFEFFGHGIVELARLSTGKSTRELEQIAEFLVYSGYDPTKVDNFLAPLMSARGGGEKAVSRRYVASLDERGELVNEGIVLTLPFLSELEDQIAERSLHQVESFGLNWLTFPIDPGQKATLYVGLRYMGVARLKGLAPCELLEAVVFSSMPGKAEEVEFELPMIGHLRRIAKTGDGVEDEVAQVSIPEDLVVISFFEKGDSRRWIFGEYRSSDRVLLHAISIPIKAEDLADGDAVEVWLFDNRQGLAKIYGSFRGETSGVSTPLSQLSKQRGFVACYLAAPHRSPE